MSKAIFLVGGGKGGVGKSLMSMALLDFLQTGGREPFLVETDTSVPDVFKAYQEEIAGELVNLDEREGWIELVNLVESKAGSTIVINTGARNQTGVSNFGRTLSRALGELGRKLVVLWMIDRKRESLELLSDFMAAIPEAEVHVVRNLYLGTEKKFELYNASKMKAGIEARGSKSVNLPELADRVTDAMNKGRMTIAKATGELSLGDPSDPAMFVGPVINEGSVERYERAIEAARRDGRVAAGGGRPDLPGHYVEPTVVADLPHGHELERNELFLPFVTVTRVGSFDEALAEANAPVYGLTAGIFTGEEAEKERFLAEIQAGVVYVNRRAGATTGAWPGTQTFCGWKSSGSTGKGGLGAWYLPQFMREQSRTIVE